MMDIIEMEKVKEVEPSAGTVGVDGKVGEVVGGSGEGAMQENVVNDSGKTLEGVKPSEGTVDEMQEGIDSSEKMLEAKVQEGTDSSKTLEAHGKVDEGVNDSGETVETNGEAETEEANSLKETVECDDKAEVVNPEETLEADTEAKDTINPSGETPEAKMQEVINPSGETVETNVMAGIEANTSKETLERNDKTEEVANLSEGTLEANGKAKEVVDSSKETLEADGKAKEAINPPGETVEAEIQQEVINSSKETFEAKVQEEAGSKEPLEANSEAKMQEEKAANPPSSRGIKASGEFETRAEKMQRMPQVISLHLPPRGTSDSGKVEGGGWGCPDKGCGKVFEGCEDRNDHAYWRHAWCWECMKGFESLSELTLSCVPSCSGKFEKPSELLAHLEGNGCATAARKGVCEHGMAHLIILEYLRGSTNEEKIYIASLDMKAIVVPKDTMWLVDPLGKDFEAFVRDVRGVLDGSLLKYTWKIQCDADAELSDISGDAKFTCLTCGEKYDQPLSFAEHIRGIERKRKRMLEIEAGRAGAVYVVWKCEGCEAVFRGLSGLAGHYEGGCRELVEEMGGLRKQWESWAELDEAMKKEVEDADDEDDGNNLVVSSEEDGNDGKNKKVSKGKGVKEESDESDDGDGPKFLKTREIGETAVSEPSSEESGGESAGEEPTGLQKMIELMGIQSEETDDEEDSDEDDSEDGDDSDEDDDDDEI
ncbi:hypothetical protein TWF481_009010 [Arthrobotrys musiformis]|uniref:C2H2-type domain-containing protein n=1 Tax=Arthrobotrys musiformis TaxID=47236 RepID=A0AAV9W4P3_9PEZI